MKSEYRFKTSELESQLKSFAEKGITELAIHDSVLCSDKKRLLHFISSVSNDAPDLFVSFRIACEILDQEIIREASCINCSIDIPVEFKSDSKNPKSQVPFFDKKLYSRKCAFLNNAGLVFGLELSYAEVPGDSLKAFKERLDFSVEQYPNHLEFPQTENAQMSQSAKVSGTFSAQDIRLARDISFAARTFYSAGRAVTWFNSVLNPLKITPSNFFHDFAEWQHCNNCDFQSGFIPENASHQDIEKMQLLFLQLKYEEKHIPHMFSAVNDIVCMNGAFSRLTGENVSSIIETEYNPEDIMGPESMDLKSFCNDVCMEHCTVQIFMNEYGEPDFKILEN